ncbi:MAG TPA: DEAD/DEAH box helicase [Polyangiaceae bacterium]|nr:DEAD/DEAH box helicase [Polyangiaceae bacterium]
MPSETGSPARARCVPSLRLFAGRVAIATTRGLSCEVEERLVPLVDLGFDYGGTRVRSSDATDRVFRCGSGGGVEPVARDAQSETSARRVLESLGAVEAECLEEVALPPGCEADYVVRADGDEHSFCSFTARALARFRALGWRVSVDAKYPFRVVDEESSFFARVEPAASGPAGEGRFRLELGVSVDGEDLDLLAALLDLLERLDGEGGLDALAKSSRGSWALRVTETHHVTVPIERLRALVRVVAELYQGQHRRDDSFPAVRMGALVALDQSFRRAGAAVRWPDRTRALNLALDPKGTPAPPPEGLCATLRPYQAAGVAFFQRLRRAGVGGLLADEMGLGKTLQTIAHICVEQEEGRLLSPALVVAPTSLVGNWCREIARFAPSLRVTVLHGSDRRRRWPGVPDAHVVITTYAVLVRDEERFAAARFHLVVLDEAQAIKNVRGQARRALARIAADHRLCLTGTPVENNLGEMWSLFDWLAPDLLGGELSFRRFWRVPIEQDADAERLGALRETVGPYVLRRLKRDVAPELPPKTETSVPVELGPRQRELYESIRVAAHADVRRAIRARGLAASTVTILDALTKLRQACCDPRLLHIDSARGVRESAKLEALTSMVVDGVAGGHRILVFSQFTSMLALVAEELRGRGMTHLVLTGATRDRQRVVDAFEDGRADVFLISLKAGGTGLNLTGADTVIHYDPWWNPAAQAQATDRAYRIGQRRPVFVHNLYAAGSVEERVLALQEKKRWLSTTLLGDGARSGVIDEGQVEALFAPLEV